MEVIETTKQGQEALQLGRFKLGEWLVNPSEGTISCDQESKRLEPKALSVLCFLAKADGDVVSRESLLDSVWPNQYVGDDVINSAIAALRRALGDDRKLNPYIKTIPKKGYCLVKQVVWQQTKTVKREHKNAVNNDQSVVSFRSISVGIILLVSVGLAVWSFTSSNIKPMVQNNSIAVLPFDVYSSNSDMPYFADGLAEEMLHQFASNSQLTVIARSASFQYRDSEKSIELIGSELNAQYLIEGSVREFNNELKITIQLIDASKNHNLWSRVFDSKSSNLFKIQEDVGMAVNDMLSIEQPDNQWNNGRQHPESDKAYQYFIMAQAHFKVAEIDSYKSAEILLEKAINIAPDYALAYASLAVSHLLQFQYNRTGLKEALVKASAALDRAFAIQPDLSEGFAAKGLMHTYDEQTEKAEQAYLQAIELNPNLRIAHHNYGFLLWGQARYKEAITHLETALAGDPLAKSTNFLMGDALGKQAYFDRAIDHYKHCQKVLSDYVWCYSGLADIYKIIGELDKAQLHMQASARLTDTGDFWRANSHANLLLTLGKFEDARQMLEDINRDTGATYPLFHNKLLLAMAKGEMSDFLSMIDQAYLQAPEIDEIKKFTAFSAYWREDYKLTVELYEALLKENPNSLFLISDYADGISHAINLADAYSKLSMQKKKQQLLMRINQHLSSFSNRLQRVPGVLYIQAKYNVLNGESISPPELLSLLKDRWALSWMINKDKFWQ